MGYGSYRYVPFQRVWFSAVLVINWVSILAILIIKRELSVRQVKEGTDLLVGHKWVIENSRFW